jgi:Acetoacetate decarboxylase (ADC)
MTIPRHTYAGIPRMPALFGRQGGPRQRLDRDGGHPIDVGSISLTWVTVEAQSDRLAALLPADFELAEPALIVEAASLKGLPWLAGRGYEMLMVSVPIVFDEPGQRVPGRLELVTWENCPDAIVSGREELGFNKVYADSMNRETSTDGQSTRYTAAWGGTQFFELDFTPSGALTSAPSTGAGPIFHYRVMPRTGEWGALELEQVTASTAALPSSRVRAAREGAGGFKFHPATFEQLPTLAHIVNTLAAIPLGRVLSAGDMEVSGWGDLADMRVVANHPTVAAVTHRLS